MSYRNHVLGPESVTLHENITNITYIIQICSDIISDRVLDGGLLYAKILEINLFAFAYELFLEDFSPEQMQTI